MRKNWDGLLPVPGKDSKYEWAGYVPFDKLPKSLNGAAGFYNSSNNDVVPKIVPGYSIPLGYEYSAPYRYDRVHEVLSEKKKFSAADMERLQQDTLSLPARELVPLLKDVTVTDPAVQDARKRLLEWNFVLDRESVPATIYEFWALKLGPLAFAPRVPEQARSSVRQYDMRRVIAWMKKPDRAYRREPRRGAQPHPRAGARRSRRRPAQALRRRHERLEVGRHPYGRLRASARRHRRRRRACSTSSRSAAAATASPCMAASSPTETSTKQTSGASFMFVMDVSDWDNSTGLSVPGQLGAAAQPALQGPDARTGEKASISRWRSAERRLSRTRRID